MDGIFSLDRWVGRQYEKFSTLCNEWLSVSHSNLMRFFVATYALSRIGETFYMPMGSKLFVYILLLILVPSFLVGIYLPETVRKTYNMTPSNILLRLANLFLVLFNAPLQFTVWHMTHSPEPLLIVLGDISFVSLLYLWTAENDGERGKKRKMAADKIKQLFGDSWQVKPLPVMGFCGKVVE